LAVLTPAQARVLAAWSFGMMVTQSCGLTTVAVFLARLLGRSYGAQRQQLREWCYAAADKRGEKRREVDVQACFAPLLRWVLASWPRGEKRLALALDATTLGQRFTVLAISVVYRGCAIPIAWAVVPATTKGKWRPHWEALLDRLDGVVPADWVVIVLADRGLYALALPGHPAAGLASLPAHQPAGAVSPDGQHALPAAGGGGAPGRDGLEWRRGLFRLLVLPVDLHARRPLDGAAHRSLADPDRPAPRGGAGRVVWHAGLD